MNEGSESESMINLSRPTILLANERGGERCEIRLVFVHEAKADDRKQNGGAAATA